jgi:hypothetical protein
MLGMSLKIFYYPHLFRLHFSVTIGTPRISSERQTAYRQTFFSKKTIVTANNIVVGSASHRNRLVNQFSVMRGLLR